MIMRTAKASALRYLLPGLYVLFGLYLFRAMPQLDELNATRFADWHTSADPLVRIFHIPGYAWLIALAAFGIALLLIGRRLQARSLMWLNIGAFAWLAVLALHLFDLFSRFLFCHEWGCSGGFLPTWRLLE